MVYPIACPNQTTDTFSIARCLDCKSFQQSMGKTHTVCCRKNRQPKHKRNFEGLFWSYVVGINDRAIVEVAEEPKDTKR